MVSSAAHTRRWNSVPAQIEVEVEVGEFAGEIGRELLDGLGEYVAIGRLPADSVGLVGLVDHPQMRQVESDAGQGERSDRAVDGAVVQRRHAHRLLRWPVVDGCSRVVHRCWVGVGPPRSPACAVRGQRPHVGRADRAARRPAAPRDRWPGRRRDRPARASRSSPPSTARFRAAPAAARAPASSRSPGSRSCCRRQGRRSARQGPLAGARAPPDEPDRSRPAARLLGKVWVRPPSRIGRPGCRRQRPAGRRGFARPWSTPVGPSTARTASSASSTVRGMRCPGALATTAPQIGVGAQRIDRPPRGRRRGPAAAGTGRSPSTGRGNRRAPAGTARGRAAVSG